MKHKHTQGNWKVRYMNGGDEKDDGECDFFIEAQEPKNQIGKIEIMMEDYGEHSGYPRQQKLADAKLIAAAPKLLSALEEAVTGLEWKKECQPTLFDKADAEKLHDWSELIKSITE